MNPRRLLAIAPAWAIATALIAPQTPLIAIALLLAALAVSLWNPAEGLLLVAGVAPLGTLIADRFGIPFRLTEAVVLAFLVGWLARAPHSGPGPRVPRAAAVAGWLFGALVVVSVVTIGLQSGRAGDWRPALEQLAWSYLFTADQIGAVEAARIIEGLAISAAVVELVRRRPMLAIHVPAALAAAATTAAAAGVMLWTRWAPAEILQAYGAVGYRVVAHVADVNAAGSFFAMMLCVALGMAARDRGRERLLWAIAVLAALAGMWLSASRSAIWSTIVVVPLIVVWLRLQAWPFRFRAAIVAALAVLLVAAGLLRARQLVEDPTFRGAGMRTQFALTSLRMIAARPAFGVGVGQYYPTSRLFLPPQLAWTYGFENAHNYLLHITAESGVIGGMLFVVFVGGLLWRAWRGVTVALRDYRLVGCVAGLVVFLGTCLTGHPLLVPEVAIAFWIVLGLAAALGGSNLSRVNPAIGAAERRWPVALTASIVAAAAALAVSVPWRAGSPQMTPPKSFAVTGRYPAEFGPDGSVFQWTADYASVFVPAATRTIELTVRAPGPALQDGTLGIAIVTGTGGAYRVLVPQYWAYPLIELDATPAAGGLKRIDIKVDRTIRLPDGRAVGIALQASGSYR